MPQFDDANQLNAALERIEATMHTQPQEAIALCRQVFADARRLREPLVHVVAAERYGLIMDHLGRGVEGRDALFEAVQVAQSAHLFVNEARLLEQIARGYYTIGEYRQAIQYWARSAEVSEQSGHDPRTWILAKIGLGQVYLAINDSYSALVLLKEAESRVAEVNDPHLDAKVKINIGVAYFNTRQYREASDIFQRALDICLKHEFWDYAAESNLRLAQVELEEGAVEQAILHLGHALPQARRVNYRWGESFILATQAEACAKRGDSQLAMEKIKEAQAISTADGFGHMLTQQHFDAARYAKQAGDFATALDEFGKGYEREQRMLDASASERNRELEEKAGLRPSVSRLLVELANNRLIEEGQLDPAFQLITKEGSRILNVGRVSVWLLDRETETLVCRCLYLADNVEFSREANWRRKDYQVYFDRLSDPNTIVAHDAFHHPHTWVLEQSYLAPRGIKSLLVFPIRVAGQTAGTVSFEALGAQRNWTPDDILNGNQLTEVAARVVTSYERRQLQQQISALNQKMMQANEMLEQRVMERTASLERHTLEMHEVQDKLFQARQKLKQVEKMAAVGESALAEIDAIESVAAEAASAGKKGEALAMRIREFAAKLRAASGVDAGSGK